MSGHSARRLGAWVLLSLLLHAWLLWPAHRPSAPLTAPGALQARLLPMPTRPAAAPPVPAPAPPTPRRAPAKAPAPAASAVVPLALQFPETGDWHYRLRWQGDEGEALLQVALGEGRYRLQLQRGTAARRLPTWTSEGLLGASGLQPQRFTAGRRELQAPPGSQDRLSWIWQAAALARSQGLKPGQALQLQVQGWRAEAEPQAWILRAEADPETPGWLRLRRELPSGARLEQLLWLDPARGHLPVRLRVRFDEAERWELELATPGRDISPTPAASE